MTKIKEYDIFITTTDTVLGIGGKINDVNKQQIYKIKKRDYAKPLIIVIGSLEQLKSLENINEEHLKYINKYWPGNVTLIINNQGYRMPNNKDLLNFILNEGPFYLTSCNISNQETIRTIQEAKKVFPDLIYFDFGSGSNKASKIIDTKTGKVIRD